MHFILPTNSYAFHKMKKIENHWARNILSFDISYIYIYISNHGMNFFNEIIITN